MVKTWSGSKGLKNFCVISKRKFRQDYSTLFCLDKCYIDLCTGFCYLRRINTVDNVFYNANF